MRRTRRRYLAAVGGAGLAGCSERSGTDTSNGDASDDSDGPSANDSHGADPDADEVTESNDDRDVGAVYIPFNGDKWRECAPNAEPTVGRYDDTHERAVVEAHVEQLLDHGIERALFNFGEEDADFDRWRSFTEARNCGELTVECFYVVSQAFERNRDVDRDLAFVREEMLGRDNYATVDGRPTVTFWWMKTPLIVPDHRRSIEREYGDFPSFVEHLRSVLTVDGVEPYLVADWNELALGGYDDWMTEAVAAFDATTNWFGELHPGDRLDWDDVLDGMEEIYQRNREFARKHDIDFVPLAFPGFDDRENQCWGEDRLIPRDPDRFADLLSVADEYRTTDLLSVATFNDWNEGHQLETGTWNGEKYGTTYLDVVSDFVAK